MLDEYGESEFAGPAAYGVAEILFTQKDYAGSFPLFHRAAAKTKQPAWHFQRGISKLVV